MNKYHENFVVALPLEEAYATVDRAVAELGWKVIEKTQRKLVCERRPTLQQLRGVMRLEITLDGSFHDQSPDKTLVEMMGLISPFGVPESSHLTEVVAALHTRILLLAAESTCEQTKLRWSPKTGQLAKIGCCS